MITAFQEFRSKWEKIADENNDQLTLYSDNNVYDGGFINQLIMDKTSQLPIPYSSDKQKYGSFFETHSMLKGILAIVDPAYNSNWGLSARVYELYNVPKKLKEPNHNPANDAYAIAFDAQVINGIREKKIELR